MLKTLARGGGRGVVERNYRGVAGAQRAGHRCWFSSFAALADEDGLAALADLTRPASWYPTARALERRVIAHVGPTNSGKTHGALAALTAAPSGIYCGPLRLLAWEVSEKLNASGVPCSMVTGQEVREVDRARHTACTVEMASTKRKVSVAVVDELQLMADPGRGWAFTRAFLGVPAKEVHVCGDGAMLPLLERLCHEAGEQLEIKRYERLSPLKVSRRPLESLDSVKKGDAVVAFSRREVHAVRHEIERSTGQRCAVVYGALPPEARAQQAALFNTPRTGMNVLAASDAVGMGLNLAIKRMVFTTLRKFDGAEERPLTAAEVKQIAGRAGRYGSRYASGTVTTLHGEDLAQLEEAMETPSDPLTSAALFPRYDQLAAFAQLSPHQGLHSVLDRFAAQAATDSHYFLARFDEMRTLAVMLRHLPLSLREAYVFAMSPCDPGDEVLASALLAFATVFAQRRPVTPALIQHPMLLRASSIEELQQLETVHKIYDLYVWLSYRLQEFQGREVALEARATCGALIDASLSHMGARKSGFI